MNNKRKMKKKKKKNHVKTTDTPEEVGIYRLPTEAPKETNSTDNWILN
jgi:hypothetical protein